MVRSVSGPAATRIVTDCRNEGGTSRAVSTTVDDLDLSLVYGQLFSAQGLCERGEYEAAVELCDGILDEWGGSSDEDISPAIAEALLCRGRSLAGLNRFAEELIAYVDLKARFGLDDSPDLLPLVAEARFNTAVAVGQMGSDEKSIGMYGSFIDRYQHDRTFGVQDLVIRARYNRAITIHYSQKLADAIPHLDQILVLYGESDDPEHDGTVVRTLLSKASLELLLERPTDAIKSAKLFLRKNGTMLPDKRLHCHLVLAGAHVISKDLVSTEKHIAQALELLPEVERLPRVENFSTMLRSIAVIVGFDRTLEFILQSKAAEMLSPTADRLKQEMHRRSDRMTRIKETTEGLRTDASFLHHRLQ